MITKVVKEYTETDKRLLSIDLPENPCSKCPDAASCCGCPKERKYAETVKPYKENGIYEVALNIARLKNIKKQITLLKKQRELLEEELPDFIKQTLS